MNIYTNLKYMETQYTGSLKTTHDGQLYTFSVKSFKLWKDRLYKEYKLKYGRSFKSDFPTKNERELVYKKLLGFNSVDIFGSGRDGFGVILQEHTYNNAKLISEIILNRQ